MTWVLVWLGAAVFVTAAFILIKGPFDVYRRMRGTRLVTCPETHKREAVNLKAAHAARYSAVASSALELKSCSRWPERHDCGQECLSQIEGDPEGCLVRTIVQKWYQGKRCVYCGATFDTVAWLDHRPALRLPDHAPVQWSTFRPESLPDVFEAYEPVCWNCYVIESLRTEHPELATER